MINKISHLGIAVKDLKYVAEQKVNVVKFNIGESTIELLEGTSPDSPISKFIEKRGEGIHHIAYESNDVKSDLKRLGDEGFELINKEPRVGSDNMLIAFVNPKSIGGVLTEVCQH
jgi:methylmalonyl-CoA/ethylmalonyl-CoA epimerase